MERKPNSPPSLQDVLTLQPSDNEHLLARNLSGGRGGLIRGGQILAQTLVAAGRARPGYVVRTAQVCFVRSAHEDQLLEYTTRELFMGRSVIVIEVRVLQGNSVICTSVVSLDAHEEDTFRYPMEFTRPGKISTGRGTEVLRQIEGSSVAASGNEYSRSDTSSRHPVAEAWFRWPLAPQEPDEVGDALIAYYTDPVLIPALLATQDGVSLGWAHDRLQTTVLTHTLTFHTHTSASDWLFIEATAHSMRSGRGYGSGRVTTEQGELVASFVQDSMVRSNRSGGGP